MIRAKRRLARSAKRLTPRVKVWLEMDGRYGFGFGVSEILRAVERAGSIMLAASDLGETTREGRTLGKLCELIYLFE